jgi:MFS family permease
MADTDAHTHGAATGTGDRSRLRAVLPVLCATQITSWGIVYYAFPVLNLQITASTGWPAGSTTAAFSAALLVSALAGIRVGRIIDHRGPRAVMTARSILGVISILIVAAAPNLPVFFAVWLLAGLAMTRLLADRAPSARSPGRRRGSRPQAGPGPHGGEGAP